MPIRHVRRFDESVWIAIKDWSQTQADVEAVSNGETPLAFPNVFVFPPLVHTFRFSPRLQRLTVKLSSCVCVMMFGKVEASRPFRYFQGDLGR